MKRYLIILLALVFVPGCGKDPDPRFSTPEKTAQVIADAVKNDSFEDFYASIRAGKCGYSSFDYAGPFTETVLMGNLSIRAGLGEKVLWDGKNMKVTNKPALNRYVSREYRKGWTL